MLQPEISQLLGLMPSGQWLQIPYAEYITWAMYYEASSADPGRVFCYLDSFTPSLSIRISGHMNLVINLLSCVFPARSHERVGHYRSKRGVLRII